MLGAVAYIMEKLAFYGKPAKKHYVLENLLKEQSYSKIETIFGLRMPKYRSDICMFDHTDGLECLIIFLFLSLSYLPLFQERDNCQFPGTRNQYKSCDLTYTRLGFRAVYINAGLPLENS